MPATHEDAELVVQITRWSTEMGVAEATRALFADSFVPGGASVDDPPVQKALNFGEIVGTLVKHDLLDRALVLDLWWITGLWSRVAEAAEKERKRLGEPRLYENFEALASSIKN
ncbi:MAG TPA: hypothetical protein VEJ84_03215 [Acidimicrobiales bacterium]|nr:hypothetical protein [Acidimicrobiales bacterium]